MIGIGYAFLAALFAGLAYRAKNRGIFWCYCLSATCWLLAMIFTYFR